MDAIGNFNQVLLLLQDCLTDELFSWEEHWKAMRLVARAHVHQGRIDSAHTVIRRLLKVNPDFKADSIADGPDLTAIARSYSAEANFLFGFSGGGFMSRIQVLESQTVFSLPESEDHDTYYTDRFGFGTGVCLGVRLLKRFYFQTEPSFAIREFLYSEEAKRPLLDLTYRDRLTYSEAPLFFSYYVGKRRLVGFFNAGLRGQYLVRSRYFFVRIDPGGVTESNLQNSRDRRQLFDVRGLFGIGVSYRIRSHQVLLSARFCPGGMNLTRGWGGPNAVALSGLGYRDDSILMHDLGMQIGYRFLLYKVYSVKYKKRDR